MTPDNNPRINEPTRLSSERALTKEEEKEFKLLHQTFIEDQEADDMYSVDNTSVQYNDGTCITLEESAKIQDKSADPTGTV
jgi:uncharacterized protein YnzC (UPF0291/DUF896 family)